MSIRQMSSENLRPKISWTGGDKQRPDRRHWRREPRCGGSLFRYRGLGEWAYHGLFGVKPIDKRGGPI
jgi:hypothetical protein